MNIQKVSDWAEWAIKITSIERCLSTWKRKSTINLTLLTLHSWILSLKFSHLSHRDRETCWKICIFKCKNHVFLIYFWSCLQIWNVFFKVLRNHVENTHNRLITFEKHLSWFSNHFLNVLFVHLANHLADESFERLIDYLISLLMIVHSST